VTVSLLLPILTPLALSFLLAGLWGPGPHPFRSHFPLKVCLAIGLALGISSCTYFGWLLIGGPSRMGLIIGESTLFIAAAGFLFSTLKKRTSHGDSVLSQESTPNPSNRWMLPALSVCAIVALITALTRFVFLSLAAPHGEIDALTIWNLRARFLARGDEQWFDSLIGLLATRVPDYPLLLPASIARWWTYIGDEPTGIPALVAMLFTFATIGLAASSLSLLRSRSQGLLAGVVLLGTPFLIRHGASQYADIPLGFFILATLVVFCLYERADGRRDGLLAMAGLMAGFAAWTKNEGLLFVLVVLLARLPVVVPARGWESYRDEMRAFAAGLLPVLLFVLFFKTYVAPGLSQIVADQGAATTIERLSDASRYVEAGQAFFKKAVRFGHPGFAVLLVYLALVGWSTDKSDRPGLRTAGAMLSLMLVGYFMVFIVTPHGVRYQIETSLDRLWMHLWPSAVFLFFLFVKTPEEVIVQNSPLSGKGDILSQVRVRQ